MSEIVCVGCGQLKGVKEYDRQLWDLHERRKDHKQNIEGLVFDGEWMQNNIQDEYDEEILDQVMSKDMYNRGLCPECGRPNLQGMTEDDFYSEEDVKELQEMWQMEAMERRMGC